MLTNLCEKLLRIKRFSTMTFVQIYFFLLKKKVLRTAKQNFMSGGFLVVVLYNHVYYYKIKLKSLLSSLRQYTGRLFILEFGPKPFRCKTLSIQKYTNYWKKV